VYVRVCVRVYTCGVEVEVGVACGGGGEREAEVCTCAAPLRGAAG